MALFDLLGRRWAMGIVWQLADGCLRFKDLKERCTTISPTILSRRIKDLIEAGLIERTLDGYVLTDLGIKLFKLLEPFQDYARDWAKQFR